VNYTGSKFRIEFSSIYAFLHIVALNRTALSYLTETLHLTADVGCVGVFGVLQCRRWLYRPHHALRCRWVIVPSRWLLLERGMLFRRLFVLRYRCCSSGAT